MTDKKDLESFLHYFGRMEHVWLYGHYIRPETIPQLVDMGAFFRLGYKYPNNLTLLNEIMDSALISNSIVFGTVKKKIYKPDNKHFLTYVCIHVDEFLRDDYNLKDRYDEVYFAQESGFKNSDGRELRVANTSESEYLIGEKVLLFLSRVEYLYNYYYCNETSNDLDENIFYNTSGKNLVKDNSQILFDKRYFTPLRPIDPEIYKFKASLTETQNTIRKVVNLINIDNFYKL